MPQFISTRCVTFWKLLYSLNKTICVFCGWVSLQPAVFFLCWWGERACTAQPCKYYKHREDFLLHGRFSFQPKQMMSFSLIFSQFVLSRLYETNNNSRLFSQRYIWLLTLHYPWGLSHIASLTNRDNSQERRDQSMAGRQSARQHYDSWKWRKEHQRAASVVKSSHRKDYNVRTVSCEFVRISAENFPINNVM